ncbi:MAG: discoidin domain-containing protein [Candidatus Latescibacterota bacterium]
MSGEGMVSGLRALAVALLAGCILPAAAAGETWVQETWRATTYYRASFRSAVTAAARLHVAAADSYEVFANGALVGADSTAARMRTFPVAVQAGDNHLAVRVANRGRGQGSGLLLLLEADSLRVPTTTDGSVVAWRWTDAEQTGAGWLTAAPGSEWAAVQSGTLDTGRVEGLVSPAPEVVAGYPGGVDIGGPGGGVRLKGIQGENLALGRPANRVETVDGSLETAWEPPVASLNFTASVDLLDRFLVRRLRVLTKGPAYADNSLRGYSVQVSDDQVRWSEVASLHGIQDPVRTQVDFPPTWTRHVRIVIVEINAVTQPKVAEIEVYGDGFVERGAYVSAPVALDSGGRRLNLGRVDWEATVPERTDLSVQFRSGESRADFGAAAEGWSPPLRAGGIWFPALEPGRLVQYRVNMETRDERRTPVFRRLRMDYSADDVPVSRASAWVTPNAVPMGVDTTFVCTVDVSFGPGDLGAERLRIAVPSETVLDPAAVSGAGVAVASWESTQSELTLWFAEPLRESGQIRIPLRTRTLANTHQFRAFAFSPGSDSPLNVMENRDEDAGSGRRHSWSVLATTAHARVLSQVQASPRVLTPNGDGVNDGTVIGFVLAKVDAPRRVRIRVRDVAGRLVATLDPPALPAGSYLRPRGAEGGTASPGFWDGRNAAGERVAPGLYVYSVEVELDSGDEVRTGTLAVVY